MAATFEAPSKRIALSARGVFQMPDPCRAPRWRCVETKDRCSANRRESAGLAEPDTVQDRYVHYQVASAQSASARRTRLRDVRIRPRKLRHPKLSETLMQDKIPPLDPCRSPSFPLTQLRLAVLARKPSR